MGRISVLLALSVLCFVTAAAQEDESCELTHPKINATAELVNFFHGIGGTVVVRDDCTFEVLNFTYDGTGPDVFWYGADTRENLDAGFIMADLPSSHGPWNGSEEMIVKIPVDMGVTWDDINVLSVWCRAFGIDFGSAVFEDTKEEEDEDENDKGDEENGEEDEDMGGDGAKDDSAEGDGAGDDGTADGNVEEGVTNGDDGAGEVEDGK